PILVHHGGERVDLFQLLGRRHFDAEIGPQPAPIVKSVLGDELYAGLDQIAQPADNLLAIKVRTVRMAERNVDRGGGAAFAPRDATAGDVAVAPRPAGAVTNTESVIVSFRVESGPPDVAQIR